MRDGQLLTTARPSQRRLLSAICLALVSVAGTVPRAALAGQPAATATSTPAVAGPRRDLGLAGAPNFRDIGGYATSDGRHVIWGRVYRSNALDKLTAADAERVAALHLAAVVDLRTAEERAQSPSVWLHPPPDAYESPKPTLAPVMRTILGNAQTEKGARDGMMKFYADMPDSYRAEYAALFRRIAHGETPLLVHCTAGKDRTGVAVALLLISVGVPRATAVADYVLTDQLVPAPAMARGGGPPGGGAQAALATLPEKSRVALWQSSRLYIDAALDAVDREYGSVEGYLSRGLQLSAAQVRAIRRAIVE